MTKAAILTGVAIATLLMGGCARLDAMRAGGEAKGLVAATLKDPSSVKWGGIWSYGGVICGYVNAKNSYGAYAGPARFFVAGKSPQIEGGDLGSSFEGLWSASCYKAEYTIANGEPAGPKATGARTPGQASVDAARLIEAIERQK